MRGVLCGILTVQLAACTTGPAGQGEFPDRLVVEIRTPYPATLMYALEAAAGRPRHDPNYKAWLLEGDDTPQWLRSYQTNRRRWLRQQDHGDGHYEPYLAASYDHQDLDDLLEAVRSLLGPADYEIASRALRAADRRLRPRWPALKKVLQRQRVQLEALLATPQAHELLATLRRSAGLRADQILHFDVVLVAKPPGESAFAHHQGRYLVLETGEESRPERTMGILMHEIAHLAAYHAPGLDQLERSFRGYGLEGVVAANLWNESYATAFGNGLAASRFDPNFKLADRLYDTPSIDALGHALHEHWREVGAVQLDGSMAAVFTPLMRDAWPSRRWSLLDVLFRHVAFTDDLPAASAFSETLGSAWSAAQHPIPAHLTRPEQLPPTTPRLVMATLGTLENRQDILELFDSDPRRIAQRIRDGRAAVCWTTDRDGVPLVLITAFDVVQLREAARKVATIARPPPPGWRKVTVTRRMTTGNPTP